MKNFTFRNIRPEEAEEAAEIERVCFPPNEACAREKMLDRIARAPECFLVAIDRDTGKMAGFLNGLSTKETRFRDGFFTDASLHDPMGRNMMLLGLDVLPEYRGQGLARELMERYCHMQREQGKQQLILTCLPSKVGMYQKMGFSDEGMADSSWGGEQWHEMRRVLFDGQSSTVSQHAACAVNRGEPIPCLPFDTVVERRGTDCLKYDFARERGMPEDVLPLWVADMDFPTAPPILERLQQRVAHGIFGYTESKEAYFQAVACWMDRQFGWQVKQDWLVKTPGVVFALATAIRAFTKEGDSVLIQQPVYYPFRGMILENRRNLVDSPLKLAGDRYEIDFEDFERKILENHVKLFLLCSPHNPVGRVWTREELRKIGDICLKHHVLVASDEIHSDFVWQGRRHHVFAALSPEYEAISITCTAPSKTFNLAGLQVSNIFIPDQDLREQFRRAMMRIGCNGINTLGLTACQAAYEEGEAWLEGLRQYIWENYLYLENFLKTRLPKVRLFPLEGTYLAWMDFRALGLSAQELEDLIVKKARLWLDRGAMFGEAGEGFERINLACPRKILEQALGQLEGAVGQSL